MKRYSNWVCHKNKIPIDPKTGNNAKSNDSTTWGTYQQAKLFMEQNKNISGIGFMFSHSPYVGIDIDHCVDAQGIMSKLALDVISIFQSYTEFSPSGTGIHIICKGKLPGAGRKNSNLGLEMYDAGRYFTVTENVLKGYTMIGERQQEIDTIYQKYFNVPKKENYQQQTLQQTYLEDDKLIEIAAKSQNGRKFLDLYAGNWQSYYNSQSEADLSFCNMLAFWTACNFDQMDRIFRVSGLMREKWDKKHGINTYGDTTITKEIDCCDTVYQPPEVRDFKNVEVKQQKQKKEQQPQSAPVQQQPKADHSLDRFHKFNGKGQITGVFDVEIVDYIITTENIIKVADVVYLYHNGVYEEDKKGEILKYKIQNLIYRDFQNSRTINRIYDLLLIQPSIKKQYWQLNQFPAYWVNFKNGMLNVQTMELLPHSAEYFSMNQIPHEYKALAKSDLVNFPHSQQFLKTSFDVQDVETVFQYMGVCLTHTILYQIFLLLLGEGANGKSLLIELFHAVIGEKNISNLSMDKLTQRFFSSQLFLKLINTCADIPKINIEDDAELKKIIGGDSIQAEFKGKDSFSFKPYAKLLFSANRFPHVDDKSDGFRRRLRVIEMNKKPQNKDIHLKQKMLKEIDFWIFTAVQGLRKVLDNHDIYESDNSKRVKENIYKNGDSIYAFIADCLQPQQGAVIKRAEMFREYDKYCQYYERARVRKRTFFDEMKAKGFETKRTTNAGYIYENYVFIIWEDEKDIFLSNE